MWKGEKEVHELPYHTSIAWAINSIADSDVLGSQRSTQESRRESICSSLG
jgi:hypothetical protein